MSKGGATKIIGLSGCLSIRMIPSGKNRNLLQSGAIAKNLNRRHPLFQVLQVQSRSWRIMAKVKMWSQISFARPEKKRMQLKKQTPNHSGGPRKVPFLVSKRSPGNTRPTFLPLSILAVQAIYLSNSSIDNSIESAKSMHSFKSYAKVAKGSNTQRNHAQNHSNVAHETPNTLC